jgi:site-specific recombinase XerD
MEAVNSHKGNRQLTERTVGYMLKRAAKRAGIAENFSPHWQRALDRGATLAEVQTTLGHANVANERLSARAAQHVERAQAGRGHFSLRTTTSFA